MGKVYCNPIVVAPQKLSCECAGDLGDLASFIYLWTCPTQANFGLAWATWLIYG